ncbi:MAG: hypothetical protein J7L77_09580 [Clostridiales bacterium]|nr:hypothetical protein [Clostridiales bacterium]
MCEDLQKQLTKLNDYINSLKIWNDYAEDCQRDYDNLLGRYNKCIKNKYYSPNPLSFKEVAVHKGVPIYTYNEGLFTYWHSEKEEDYASGFTTLAEAKNWVEKDLAYKGK